MIFIIYQCILYTLDLTLGQGIMYIIPISYLFFIFKYLKVISTGTGPSKLR